MSNYLISGGDGYSMLKNNNGVTKGENAIQFLESYLKENSPISTPQDLRIADISKFGFATQKSACNSGFAIVSHNAMLLQCLMFIILVVNFL